MIWKRPALLNQLSLNSPLMARRSTGPSRALWATRTAVERSLKVGAPERQELVELGKAWSQIILMPDELLQDRAVVGHAVENAGRGQAIALQLTSKVARHHRAPPLRAAQSATRALSEVMQSSCHEFHSGHWHSHPSSANKILACERALD